MKTCFVVSPIGDVGRETRINADKLFKYIIRPVCESCGLEAVRTSEKRYELFTRFLFALCLSALMISCCEYVVITAKSNSCFVFLIIQLNDTSTFASIEGVINFVSLNFMPWWIFTHPKYPESQYL